MRKISVLYSITDRFSVEQIDQLLFKANSISQSELRYVSTPRGVGRGGELLLTVFRMEVVGPGTHGGIIIRHLSDTVHVG